jgi:hypothetical protein
MRECGWRPHEVWLSPAGQERLRRCQHFSESISETMERALMALDAASTVKAASEPTPVLAPQSIPKLAPSGKPNSKPSDDPRREQLKRRCRELKAEGLSAAAIARKLQAEGVPTLSGRGRWRHPAVIELLGEEMT